MGDSEDGAGLDLGAFLATKRAGVALPDSIRSPLHDALAQLGVSSEEAVCNLGIDIIESALEEEIGGPVRKSIRLMIEKWLADAPVAEKAPFLPQINTN